MERLTDLKDNPRQNEAGFHINADGAKNLPESRGIALRRGGKPRDKLEREEKGE